MDSNTCGKACLIGCIILVVIGIIAGIGCWIIAKKYAGPMLSVMENSEELRAHFSDLRSQGWDVDDSRAQQQPMGPQPYAPGYGTGGSLALQTLIFRARENDDDDWITYVWEMTIKDPAAAQGNDIEAMFDWVLVPRNEAALEVHEDLDLPLDESFNLDPWEESDYQAIGITDWQGSERDRDDRDDDSDGEDGEDGEDDEDNENDENGERRSKRLKRAA